MKLSVLFRCWPDSRAQVIQVWPHLTLVNRLPAPVKVSIMVTWDYMMQTRQHLAFFIYPRSGKPKSECQMTGLFHVLSPSSPIPEPIQSQKVVVQMAWPHASGICKSTHSWLHVFISVPLIEIRWHLLKVHQGKLLSSHFPESWNILLTPKLPLCSVCQYGNLKYLIANLFFRSTSQ